MTTTGSSCATCWFFSSRCCSITCAISRLCRYRWSQRSIDLIFKGERQGALFYQVLKWGAHSERVIDVYSAIEKHEKPGVNPNYTVDAVIARLEGVLVREVEKGGTAASVKAAMDRTIDQIQIETSGSREAVARATNKLRSKFDREPSADD